MRRVGDKVTIKADLEEGLIYYMDNEEYYDGIVLEMHNFLGKEATIVSANEEGYCLDIDEECWHWTDQMFENEEN